MDNRWKHLSWKKDIKKKEILIYQFAYNDLSQSYLHGRNTEFENFGPEPQSTFYKTIAINTAKFRYKYLNKHISINILCELNMFSFSFFVSRC